MKKMLFIIPSFQHGGTNRSFCNMIDLFDFKSHNISVDLLCVKGMYNTTYLNEFKSRKINVLPENYILSLISYNGNNLVRRFLKKCFNFLPQKLIHFFTKTSCLKYNNRYDAVISMEEGISTYIASCIKSKKTIVWLRCMYDRYFELTNHKDESEIYDKVNSIVCVSKECQKSFTSIYPQFTNKTICIPNTQNREAILEKSNAATDVIFDKNFYNIVSVGRLDEVKQFHLIPEIVKSILEKGIPVKWYIIGEGYYQKEILKKIERYDVSEYVLLVGSRANPYPIMKKADLIAVTSVSESFCNVIAEGIILNRNIISTSFPAVYDTMDNYPQGIICCLDNFATEIYKLFHSAHIDSETKITKNKDDKKIMDYIERLEKVF